MTTPKQQSELGWNIVFCLSILGILVAGWFAFAPKPHPTAPNSGQESLKEVENASKGLDARAADEQQRVADRTWDDNADVLGSRVLDALTRLSEKHHLQLTGFRIGKPIPASNLQEVPFVAILDGSFMEVMAELNGLEDPDSKLAVSQIQIASNSGSDLVTATISLTGFLYKEAK